MSKRVPLPESLTDAPFAYQHGRDAGFTHKRLRGSDLTSPFKGTRDATSDGSTRRLCLAYATQMDERCFFSSVTAAQLMSIPLPPRVDKRGAIHVAIVSPHRGLEGVRVIGHKVQLMGGDVWHQGGLLMSSPARVWCELGVLLTIPELVAAGDYIIHWSAPLASHVDLMDAVDRYPDRRGKRKLRAALPLLDVRSESPMESMLRAILTLGGIAGIVTNYPIRVRGRSFRLDLAIPSHRVAIEYQGDYHREVGQWRRDMTRRSMIESDHWKYIEVNGDDIRDSAELIGRVKAFMR